MKSPLPGTGIREVTANPNLRMMEWLIVLSKRTMLIDVKSAELGGNRRFARALMENVE